MKKKAEKPKEERCPLAAACWMGGGSYACVRTPPFCTTPLIEKEEKKKRGEKK